MMIQANLPDIMTASIRGPTFLINIEQHFQFMITVCSGKCLAGQSSRPGSVEQRQQRMFRYSSYRIGTHADKAPFPRTLICRVYT